MGSLLLTSAPLDGVVTLTLDRPAKRNALSTALRDEVSDALDRCGADESVRVVVLTGAGTTFCAGFDLDEFQDTDPEHQRALWASSDRFHRTVLTFPLPLVAAINGPAMAGGFDLAVMADVRVAADTARFAHPERTWSEVVYRPLRELVGGAVARDLVLTGRSVDATEAQRIGLVRDVVPPAELAGAAAAVAAAIAESPRHVLVKMKAKIVAAAGVWTDTGTLSL